MVLLPKPPAPKDSNSEIKRNVFFENDAMDHLAKHFVGNNFRSVQSVPFIKNEFSIQWLDA